MKNNKVLRGLIVGSVLLLMIAPAVASISLRDVLARTSETYEVQSARLTVDRAEKELERVRFVGDPSASLDPQVKAITRVGESFAEEVALSATASAKLPLGLSQIEKEKVQAASDAFAMARDRLAQAEAEAFLKAYQLYQATWLVQEEQNVLKAELDAALAYTAALRERFQVGDVSLTELSEAEEDLQRREEAVLEGGLKHRLSWLEIAYTYDFVLTPETPVLEAVTEYSGLSELPNPPSLAAWAFDHDPELNALNTGITQIDDTLARLGKVDLSVSLKGFGGVFDHSASLTYTFQEPQLSASYSFPIYSFGEVPTSGSGTSEDTWNVGFSVGLSYINGRADTLEIASLALERELEAAKVEARKQSLELKIRGQYQQWLKAVQSQEQARRNMERVEQNRKILDSKRSLGLVNDYDILEADALRERARWSVVAADIEERIQRMSAAMSASYLTEIVERL
jgi:outer membrane protein TolC